MFLSVLYVGNLLQKQHVIKAALGEKILSGTALESCRNATRHHTPKEKELRIIHSSDWIQVLQF